MALPVSRVAQAGPNEFLVQFRKILYNVGITHAVTQPTQHIIHANAGTNNARPAKSDLRVDAN